MSSPSARTFQRGARPTPRHKLAAASPFRPLYGAPPQVAYVPLKLSVWGNDRYGDCVTAEEAFKCACDNPENFVPESEVINWAQSHGFLNGADLLEVIQAMQRGGFRVDPNQLNDGKEQSVDFSVESILQAALAQGPVKIGIDANALPPGAGSHSGWYSFGGARYTNEDHCVALAGYGPASFCFGALGVPVPAGIDINKPCYLLFTWGTIGVVDHAWIMGTCGEAWLRNPNTVVVGPGPQPVPPMPPVPPGPPAPPVPLSASFDVDCHLGMGLVSLPSKGTIKAVPSLQLGGAAQAHAIPPWVLVVLSALCSMSPALPPPWDRYAGFVCSLIPPPVKVPCDCH